MAESSPGSPDPVATPGPRSRRWTLRDQLFWLIACAATFGAVRLVEPRFYLVTAAGCFWAIVFVMALRKRHLLALNVQWALLSSALVVVAVPFQAGRDWDTIANFGAAALWISALMALAALSADDFKDDPHRRSRPPA